MGRLMSLTGWDIGGAHLKAARLNDDGRITAVVQVPCPLWQGMDQLDLAIDAAIAELGPPDRSAVTMTGELSDLFADRADGVQRITEHMTQRLGEHLILFGADPDWSSPAEARTHAWAIASANWLASARLVADRLPAGLFVDVGSTTTDLIPLVDGDVRSLGVTDAERMAEEELLYTGVVRTPVMAIAGRVPFDGAWLAPMAELYATAADEHRLLGVLPEHADQHPAADGGEKTIPGSARRLLRMVGQDLDERTTEAARNLAEYLAEIQLRTLYDAAVRLISREALPGDVPVVGCGVGRFMAQLLADRLDRPYCNFAGVIDADVSVANQADDCAPAVAVALLAHQAQGG